MNDAMPSSPRSSSDSDGAGRVFMGPKQPQEDMLVHMCSPVKDNCTLHAPPTFTSSPGPSTMKENHASQANFGDNEYIQRTPVASTSADIEGPLTVEVSASEGVILEEDEPSSAIACRIMRAHDNPSPPPFVVHPSPPISPSDKVFHEHTPIPNPYPGIATDDQLNQPEGQNSVIVELSSQDMRNDEQDLIFFDQSVIIPDSQDTSVTVSQGSHQLVPSIDDLLFSSPMQALITQEGSVGTKLLQIPNDETPRRRSPRLSSIVPPAGSQQEDAHPTPGEHTPSQNRKRRREDGEKLIRLTPSPVKIIWPVDLETSKDELQTLASRQRRERKRFKKGEDNDMGLCLTGSLSPDSADILSGLLFPVSEEGAPTTGAPPDNLSESSDVKDDETESRREQSPIPPPTPSVVQEHRSPSTPQGKPPAPRDYLLPSFPISPSKLTLSVATDDPNRTPARRVPIFMPPGSSDIRAASRSINFPPVTHPVFSRPPPNDPNRSPARRVPAPSIVQEKPGNREGSSPHRPVAKSAQGNLQKVTKKPVDTIAKDNKPRGTQSTSALPLPSGLTGNKADTNKSSSRIPRVNSLPKPNPHIRVSKLPAPSSKKGAGLPTWHGRSASSSKEDTSMAISQPPPPTSVEYAASRTDLSQTSDKLAAAPQNKTVTQRTTYRPERNGNTTQAPIRMRQVIPGMFGGPGPNKTVGIVKEPEGNSVFTSPIKPSVQRSAPIRAREVVKGTLQKFELKESSSKTLQALADSRTKAESDHSTPVGASEETSPQRTCPNLENFTFSCPLPPEDDHEMDDAETEIVSSPHVDEIETAESLASAPGISLPQTVGESSTRRSSRTRRPVQSTDIFSTIHAGPSKPKRRAIGVSAPPGDLFIRHNNTALRTLTNTNTTRNQRYTAELEFMIIRKAGKRPESPTMKLRTIQEKQKDEQGKLRAERARRRRGEDDGDSSLDLDMHDISIDMVKHRRGPGEDEDYETPLRPLGRKGVKWDRGLETAKFIDDIEVQPPRQQGNQIDPPRKSCLRTSHQVVSLDGLGNATDPTPLQLEQQKVVVTKFVYDNDEEAVIEQPRSTRSKTRKGR